MSEQEKRMQEIEARAKSVAEFGSVGLTSDQNQEYHYIDRDSNHDWANPMITQMDERMYKTVHERLDRLMSHDRMRQNGLSGKREEGYITGILACKSLFHELFKQEERK